MIMLKLLDLHNRLTSQPKVAVSSYTSQVEGFVLDSRLEEIWEEYNQALYSNTDEP